MSRGCRGTKYLTAVATLSEDEPQIKELRVNGQQEAQQANFDGTI